MRRFANVLNLVGMVRHLSVDGLVLTVLDTIVAVVASDNIHKSIRYHPEVRDCVFG